MEKYICENVFVPLRSGPSHKSEMLSQVLFGEKYIIIDQAGKWLKIQTIFDNYTGWMDKDHLQQSESKDDQQGHVLLKNLLCYKPDKTKIVLEPGCEIHNPDFTNKTFTTANSVYTTAPDFNESYIKNSDSLPERAMKFLNSPYIWGGRIPSGIDCSGMTQLIYKMHGIKIPRDSSQQAGTGETISFINDSKPGDLAFFDNEKGNISHVGMIFSSGLIIHASGRVRIDTIDHQGIFKEEIGRYSHRLRTIKRIIV
jgi:gamma-D-glutamyl-L-lysine dipeptidyl-peptidase